MTGPQAPPGEEQRPRVGTEGAATNITDALSLTDAGDIPTQLRRRRGGSLRLPPFCGCGHRDPLAHRIEPDGPSTFGLTDDELRRHANDLVQIHGWSAEEVMAVLDVTLRAAP